MAIRAKIGRRPTRNQKKVEMQIEGPVFAVTTPFAEETIGSSDTGEYRQLRVDEHGLVRSLQFLTAKVSLQAILMAVIIF